MAPELPPDRAISPSGKSVIAEPIVGEDGARLHKLTALTMEFDGTEMIWILALTMAAGASAAAPSGISEMPHFMTGCWEQQTTKGFDEECWTDGRAGLMMGTGRYIADEAIEHWEWMRIVRGADGRLSFNASPTGDPMVTFGAVEQTGGSVTFAKDDYAYFQRIRYTRTERGMDVELLFKDGKLLARRSYRSTSNATSK